MVPSILPQSPSVVAQAGVATAVLKPGQVLEALVLGKTPDGMVALKIGDMVLTTQLPQPLPPGTTLQLQVRTGGPSPQLLLIGTPHLRTVAAPASAAPVLPLSPLATPPSVTIAPTARGRRRLRRRQRCRPCQCRTRPLRMWQRPPGRFRPRRRRCRLYRRCPWRRRCLPFKLAAIRSP